MKISYLIALALIFVSGNGYAQGQDHSSGMYNRFKTIFGNDKAKLKREAEARANEAAEAERARKAEMNDEQRSREASYRMNRDACSNGLSLSDYCGNARKDAMKLCESGVNEFCDKTSDASEYESTTPFEERTQMADPGAEMMRDSGYDIPSGADGDCSTCG